MRNKILIMILVTVISLTACTNPSTDDQTVDEENKNLVEVNVKDKELLNKSEEISDLVVELYGIDDVATIVFNNNAYVAIIMAFDHEFSEDLGDTVINLVKEKHNDIENVSLSTNPKVFKQVDDVVFNLLQGKSYDSQVKEVNKIISKY